MFSGISSPSKPSLCKQQFPVTLNVRSDNIKGFIVQNDIARTQNGKTIVLAIAKEKQYDKHQQHELELDEAFHNHSYLCYQIRESLIKLRRSNFLKT